MEEESCPVAEPSDPRTTFSTPMPKQQGHSFSGRKKYTTWTGKEIGSLIDGVVKHGPRWAKVHKYFAKKVPLPRSVEKLREKWHRLKKQAERGSRQLSASQRQQVLRLVWEDAEPQLTPSPSREQRAVRRAQVGAAAAAAATAEAGPAAAEPVGGQQQPPLPAAGGRHVSWGDGRDDGPFQAQRRQQGQQAQQGQQQAKNSMVAWLKRILAPVPVVQLQPAYRPPQQEGPPLQRSPPQCPQQHAEAAEQGPGSAHDPFPTKGPWSQRPTQGPSPSRSNEFAAAAGGAAKLAGPACTAAAAAAVAAATDGGAEPAVAALTAHQVHQDWGSDVEDEEEGGPQHYAHLGAGSPLQPALQPEDAAAGLLMAQQQQPQPRQGQKRRREEGAEGQGNAAGMGPGPQGGHAALPGAATLGAAEGSSLLHQQPEGPTEIEERQHHPPAGGPAVAVLAVEPEVLDLTGESGDDEPQVKGRLGMRGALGPAAAGAGAAGADSQGKPTAAAGEMYPGSLGANSLFEEFIDLATCMLRVQVTKERAQAAKLQQLEGSVAELLAVVRAHGLPVACPPLPAAGFAAD